MDLFIGNHMKNIIIKILVFVVVFVLPFVYSEYNYRQNIGDRTGICIKTWQTESCYKGRNCRYTDRGLLLYDDNTVESVVGVYEKGKFYTTKDEWNIVANNYNRTTKTTKLDEILLVYRFAVYIILLFSGVLISVFILVLILIWIFAPKLLQS